MGVVKLPNEEVRQMMQSLAVQKFIPQHGWEFKLETDLDFINRYVRIIVMQIDTDILLTSGILADKPTSLQHMA